MAQETRELQLRVRPGENNGVWVEISQRGSMYAFWVSMKDLRGWMKTVTDVYGTPDDPRLPPEKGRCPTS